MSKVSALDEIINGISTAIADLSSADFSLNEAFVVLKPLVIFTLGIVIYAIFIFKFYRFIASKDVFEWDLQEYGEGFSGFIETFMWIVVQILVYLIVYPITIFFAFLIVSALFIFLSTQTIGTIFLVTIALISTIRITAYYNEDLSKDLAKMLPFALLAIFLLDIGSISQNILLDRIQEIIGQLKSLFYYLLFVVLLELVLRGLNLVFSVEPIQEEDTEE